jgi:release factor glutamine methyltransferase
MPDLASGFSVLLRDGAERLTRAGVPEPRRQAIRIWDELNPVMHAGSLLAGSIEMEPAVATKFQRAIERRAAGEPLPYVTGFSGFRYLTLRSDSRALIPRPETEGLVDLLLQRLGTGRVADVGTGTGCIALSLAREGNFSQVIGIDYSRQALSLAVENREWAGVDVELVQGDLCAPLAGGVLDALISNPPYLTADEYACLDPSVRDWEPAMALLGGRDGMEVTAQLLDQGRRVLRSGGWLALEIDCTRAEAVSQLAAALGWEDVGIHMDLFGRERYLLARRSNTR